MKHLFPLLSLLVLLSCGETPVSSQPATGKPTAPDILFGTTYTDISEISQLKGYQHAAGALLDVKNDAGKYAFSIGQYRNGKETLLLFNELAHYEGNLPVWTLRDTIHIRTERKGTDLTLCNCELNEIPDKEIIALVEEADKEYLDGITAAWRADTKTKKITRLRTTKGIRCINEGYGCE